MNTLQIGRFTVFTKLNIYRFYYVYLLISGQDARTTRKRNFGIFFKLEVSNLKWCVTLSLTHPTFALYLRLQNQQISCFILLAAF
jgi:hypothetical protein